MSSCSASTSRNPERTDSPTSSGWASCGRASPTTTVASPCRTACSVRRKRSSSGPTGSSRDGTSARSTRRPSSPPSRSSAGRPRHDESPSPHRDRGPRACGRARLRGASARDHGRRAGGSDHDRAQMSGLSRPFGEGLDVGDGSPDARPRRTARARRPLAWPADPPDQRDDVARAVSSLRDLEFARAAGTIATEDYVRLRASLERDAFVRRPPESRGNAPVRTLVAAALIAAIAVAVAVFYLPPSVGDRAPGETVTGTVPQTDALAALEVRASANPSDVPTQLALADAYVQAGRPQDAIPRYQAVLAKDPNNVAALDGLALILVASGSNDGAIVAADRVIAQRPKDPDALFVKGLALYRKQDWNGAVDVWTVYLDVGHYHFGSDMVRGL